MEIHISRRHNIMKKRLRFTWTQSFLSLRLKKKKRSQGVRQGFVGGRGTICQGCIAFLAKIGWGSRQEASTFILSRFGRAPASGIGARENSEIQL